MIEREAPPWGYDDRTIGAMLETRAARDGDWPFARIGERTVTIAELADKVNCAAEGLTACGIRRGDRVALMLANHMDHVAVFFAVITLAGSFFRGGGWVWTWPWQGEFFDL